jgi:hypothetical protein
MKWLRGGLAGAHARPGSRGTACRGHARPSPGRKKKRGTGPAPFISLLLMVTVQRSGVSFWRPALGSVL